MHFGLYFNWLFPFKMDKKNPQLIREACWEYESASDSLWLYFDLFVFVIFTSVDLQVVCY